MSVQTHTKVCRCSVGPLCQKRYSQQPEPEARNQLEIASLEDRAKNHCMLLLTRILQDPECMMTSWDKELATVVTRAAARSAQSTSVSSYCPPKEMYTSTAS